MIVKKVFGVMLSMLGFIILQGTFSAVASAPAWDCDTTNTGLTPLTDFSAEETYNGFQGGLYPGVNNRLFHNLPENQIHADEGLRRALNEIERLCHDGTRPHNGQCPELYYRCNAGEHPPCCPNGLEFDDSTNNCLEPKIVLLSIGHTNTMVLFHAFNKLVAQDSRVNTLNLRLVNGGLPLGQVSGTWDDPYKGSWHFWQSNVYSSAIENARGCFEESEKNCSRDSDCDPEMNGFCGMNDYSMKCNYEVTCLSSCTPGAWNTIPYCYSNFNNYDHLESRLEMPLNPQQVQVVLMQQANFSFVPRGNVPGANEVLLEELGDIVRSLKVRYPNLQMVFTTSSLYGGYADNGAHAASFYDNGFAVKWLIESQIKQMASVPDKYQEATGDLDYSSTGPVPWIAWGPYLWTDGARGRDIDDLVWECALFDGDPDKICCAAPDNCDDSRHCNGNDDCIISPYNKCVMLQNSDFNMDGLHLCRTGKDRECFANNNGSAKPARLLLNYFLNSPYTIQWFCNDAELVRINNMSGNIKELSAAYDAAASQGTTIKAHARKFSENLDFNENKSVTLDGGYNCDFSCDGNNSGSNCSPSEDLQGYIPTPRKTVVKGSVRITGGKVTVKNLILAK